MFNALKSALIAYAVQVAMDLFRMFVATAVRAVEQWAANYQKQHGEAVPSEAKKSMAFSKLDAAVKLNPALAVLGIDAERIDDAIEAAVAETNLYK